MKTEEGYKILVESLLHTENTKGAYFLEKSKELEIDPFSFFTDLNGIYRIMEEEVNSKYIDHWAVDKNGNKEAIYNTINLSRFLPQKYTLYIDKENIRMFLPGLEQFGKIIMNELKEKQKAKTSELIDNKLKTNIEPPKPALIPQLSTKLTIDKRNSLFDLLVKGKFIPNENKDCFIWAFGKPDEKQPDQWQPIDWKLSKQLLRELLEAIKSDATIKAEMERIAPLLFIYKGKSMKLAKNKVKETQNHNRLNKIIATILNY